MVFPFSRAEAKTLFKSGHKTKGLLSRQSGEPMSSYVSRRRRWWKKLKHMDSSVGLSDTVLGDLMLEASGLKEDQQRMILTSTANNREFEKLAAALVEQYPNVHHDEKKTSYPGPGAKAGGKHRKPYRHARLAGDEECEDNEESSDE